MRLCSEHILMKTEGHTVHKQEARKDKYERMLGKEYEKMR